MFARIEVGGRPEFPDPQGEAFFSRLRLALPHIAAKVRKLRFLDVYWLHFEAKEKEVSKAVTEIFGDEVLSRLFTLLPGVGLEPGMIEEYFQQGDGDVSAIERRYRPGVTDNVAKTAHEAFEIVFGKKFPSGWVASGSLLLVEGQGLSQSDLDEMASGLLCNGLIERWKIFSHAEIAGDQRFDSEEVEKEYRRVSAWSAGGASHSDAEAETYDFGSMDGPALEELSRRKLWALSREEMLVIAKHFDRPATDVEIEVIAQTWSEHCKHKLFAARITYSEDAGLPSWCTKLAPSGGILEVDGIFKTYISGTTRQIERPWLLSVFRTMPESSRSMPTARFASKWRPTTRHRLWTRTAVRSPALSESTGIFSVAAWDPCRSATWTCFAWRRQITVVRSRNGSCIRAGSWVASAAASKTAETRVEFQPSREHWFLTIVTSVNR